jgi:Ca-activated chloride channel family protein
MSWDLATPLALLLLPLPLLALLLLPPLRGADGALRVPASLVSGSGAAVPDLASGANRQVLAWLIWIALVLALAGPRMVTTTGPVAASGREIVLALDLSGSMERRDFEIEGQQASRLEALKKVGGEFIRRRAGDRIGLVVFAEEAFAASPPSFDVASVSRLLEDSTIGVVGRSTAIGAGLGLALKRLAASDARTRIIVLLSDGANNGGAAGPIEVARLAAALGVRIYTIALGLRDTTDRGDDPDAVDAVTLKTVAEVSGGATFRVRTTAELDDANRAIEALVAGPANAPPRVVYRQLWPYPASLALLFSVIVMVGRRRA